jgi:restriction system protein
MVFSTSGFQDGALRFASEHGIALIRIIEGKYTYLTKGINSQDFEPPPWADCPKFVGEFRDQNFVYYLHKGYMNSLESFIFDTKR